MSPGRPDEAVIRRHLVALDEALQTLRKHQGRAAGILKTDREEFWVGFSVGTGPNPGLRASPSGPSSSLCCLSWSPSPHFEARPGPSRCETVSCRGRDRLYRSPRRPTG